MMYEAYIANAGVVYVDIVRLSWQDYFQIVFTTMQMTISYHPY